MVHLMHSGVINLSDTMESYLDSIILIKGLYRIKGVKHFSIILKHMSLDILLAEF